MRVTILCIVSLGTVLMGCTTQPVLTRSSFERCMDQLGYKFHYTSDMIRAADWCRNNDNGGIR